MGIVDINENMPHIVSEVICVKCGKRWIAVRPETVWLKDIECKKCGPGYVVETGQNIDMYECGKYPGREG